MVSTDDVAKTLNAAADHIETHGWWKPGLGDRDSSFHGAVCIMNAIMKVSGDSLLSELQQVAQDAVTDHFHLDAITQVFDLNDSQSEDSGKEWAIRNLRETADEVLRNNSREVASNGSDD